ncbi:MAG: transposase [Cyanobacteriota bacterium]|nr:transposase [Cyanobacteriota bacterium]
MILAHVYKLKPNSTQCALMTNWLSMLRAHYNFCLRDRIGAFEQTRSPVLGNYSNLGNQGECCPLACSVSKSATVGYPWTKAGKRRSAGMQQDAYLPEMKAARPWYKQINADVLQMNLRRLNNAFSRFFDGQGKYPRFKNKSKFRSFSYKPKQVKTKGNKVYLPGIGWMRFYLSRPLPVGFEVRTVTVRQKGEGWYISVRLENKNVPALTPMDASQVKKVVAADLGIRKLAALNTGELILNPNFAKKVARRKRIILIAASRKVKGSKNRSKAYIRLAKLDLKVGNQRDDYQWKVANKLCSLGDAIIFEALNIRGMMARCKPKRCPETGKYLKNGQAAKRGLNRVIADAAWGELKLKTKAVAAKLGLIVAEVDPKFSSQQCSCCGHIDKANRDKERFLCTECGYVEDADVQASLNLLGRGLKQLGISPTQLRAVRPKVTLKETSLTLVDEPKNPQQLRLFEWRDGQVTGYSDSASIPLKRLVVE